MILLTSCVCSTASLKLCVLVLLAHTGLLDFISKLECKFPLSVSGVPCSQGSPLRVLRTPLDVRLL